MRAVHLTKITARLDRVRVSLLNARVMQGDADLERLIDIDVPDLIQAVRDAKADADAARRELAQSKEATTRYAVTVYSDSPMKISREVMAGEAV
jgi:hypothetical protein